MALAQAHVGPDDPMVRRAVAWLRQQQNADGGWGESNDSYALQARPPEDFGSTPYQTAWALLGLLAAGEAGSDAARRGAEYLLHTRQPDGLWSRSELYRAGVSTGVLPALSRLLGLFSVVGVGRLP